MASSLEPSLNLVPTPPEDLNPPLRPFAEGIPDSVLETRRRRSEQDVRTRLVYESRIDAHIKFHRGVLDYLTNMHQWVADTYDFDIAANTRLVGLWEMAGRCLGIAKLILDSLEMGYTAEVLHLGRAVHEANRLLNVFHMQGEDDLVRRWLDGEYVSPGECRQAEERFDMFLAEEMKRRGHEPIGVERGELSRDMYGKLSEAAHHRRKWTQDVVFVEERAMFTGPTSDYYRRAATVSSLILVVEETVIGVGDAISQVVPDRDWYSTSVKPLIETFAILRVTQPLPET